MTLELLDINRNRPFGKQVIQTLRKFTNLPDLCQGPIRHKLTLGQRVAPRNPRKPDKSLVLRALRPSTNTTQPCTRKSKVCERPVDTAARRVRRYLTSHLEK